MTEKRLSGKIQRNLRQQNHNPVSDFGPEIASEFESETNRRTVMGCIRHALARVPLGNVSTITASRYRS
jgi:hypothetical protein